MTSWDGIYAVYMSGTDGQGFGMFSFRDGRIHGADPLGVRFGGTYKVAEDGSLNGLVRVAVPPSDTVIQGVKAGPTGFTYEVPIDLSADAMDQPFIRLETPLGPVNYKLDKLSDFESDI